MPPHGRKPTSEIIREFLERNGAEGATLREIYEAVRRTRDRSSSGDTIRGKIYRRLPTSKATYRKTLERIILRGETRDRVLGGRFREPRA